MFTTAHAPRHGHVDDGGCQRGKCQRLRLPLQQRPLQQQADQRSAEDQAAVDHLAALRFGVAQIEQWNRQVKQEIQQQERLGTGEQFRPVLQHAPGGADAERRHEAQQVQHPPRALPRDSENGQVEHGVVTEQRHMAALAGRGEDRCEETCQQRQHRQRQGVLQHRQHTHSGHQHQQHDEGRLWRQQRIQPERSEDGDQQHADGATLQRQREAPARIALTPAEDQRRNRRHRHRAQPQRDGHVQHAGVGGVLEQGGHAGKQHQHADLHRHIAFGEPARDARGQDSGGIGLHGRVRRHRRSDARARQRCG